MTIMVIPLEAEETGPVVDGGFDRPGQISLGFVARQMSRKNSAEISEAALARGVSPWFRISQAFQVQIADTRRSKPSG